MSPARELGKLVDFTSFVLLCAPDRFPADDPRLPGLEPSFELLRQGLDSVKGLLAGDDAVRALHDTLVRSLAAYRSGDPAKGAHLLHDFEEALLSCRR